MMKNRTEIPEIVFERIKDMVNVDYMDETIAFHTNMAQLPLNGDARRLDMYVMVVCVKGHMTLELNTVPYELNRNEVLVCRPNDLVQSCRLSPDFDGAVLWLSQRGLLEQVSDSILWDKVFYFAEHPVVKISEDSLYMFNLYGAALWTKIRVGNRSYRKEIVVNVVKAVLYELLANVGSETPPPENTHPVRQREALFKQFINLLTGCKTKPRTVAWYADQLCITPKYLSSVCKQVSGKTAFAWINEYMLIDIRYWLKNTNRTMKEVADLLGFPNNSFFGKYCRAHFGMSPTAYRKKLREKP